MAVDMVKIWDRFRQGDDEAFAVLFNTYVDVLYDYGRKLVSDDELVKDCVQDLFVKTRRTTYVSPDDLPFLAAGYYLHEGNSPEDAETGERLKRALSVLNARQKEAIYLRFQLGLSYEEVSKLLGINYQSTRNLIHSSITKVRTAADLRRWRAMDQMIATPYHIEGFKLWGPMNEWYADISNLLTYGIGDASTVSDPALGKYLRVHQKTTTSLAYNGYRWAMAHYWSPVAISHFLIASENSDVASSPLYQNPGWPAEANGTPVY